MRARAGYQRSETRQEVERLESDRRRAVAPVPAQRVDYAAIGSERETIHLDRGTGDIAAQTLQPFTVAGLDPHLRVQREPLEVAAQLGNVSCACASAATRASCSSRAPNDARTRARQVPIFPPSAFTITITPDRAGIVSL